MTTPPTPFFNFLQEQTLTKRQSLLSTPAITEALAGKVTLTRYLAFLEQAYHHVRHTAGIFMAAGSRLTDRPWAARALAEYIEEEIGHDEWILNDIEACGGDREGVKKSRPCLPIELMVAYAYDTAMRNNPLAVFGFVQVLEGTSVTIATPVANILREQLSLNDHQLSYLISHGELDQDHFAFYEKTINLVTHDRDQNDIIHCANTVYQLYADMFQQLPA